MKNLILKQVAIVLVALGFTACDEVSKLFTSIKEPIVQLEKGFDRDFKPFTNLVIQSQDNEMVIESIKLNEGNCPVITHTANKQSWIRYIQNYPERGIVDTRTFGIQVLPMIKMKNSTDVFTLHNSNGADLGFKVEADGLKPRTGWGGGILVGYDSYLTAEEYEEIEELTKTAYIAQYPVKLPFGEKFIPKVKCSESSIIKVELETNGGSFVFDLGAMQ